MTQPSDTHVTAAAPGPDTHITATPGHDHGQEPAIDELTQSETRDGKRGELEDMFLSMDRARSIEEDLDEAVGDDGLR